MKRIFLICFLGILSFNIFCQTKFVHGISDSVDYQFYYEEPELDSVTIVMYNVQDLCIPNIEVFFDKKMKNLAYKSWQNQDSCFTVDYWRNGNIKMKNIYVWDELAKLHRWDHNEVYCENGQLIRKCKISNTDKVFIENFYCNGQKRNQFSRTIVWITGERLDWYENGQMKMTQNYDSKGKKCGIWKYWKEDGTILKIEHYKNDTLIKN